MVHSLHVGCRRFDILVVGVYWYWVAAVYELWAARQTSPIWRASTTPQQLFRIWEQSQVSSLAFQNSVCSTLPKILQIHWTAILRWQSRHNHVRCYISSQFFICVNIVRWEGACITDRTKVYKILYSKNLNIKTPPSPYNKSFWCWLKSIVRPRYTNSIALAWEQWMADVMQVEIQRSFF